MFCIYLYIHQWSLVYLQKVGELIQEIIGSYSSLVVEKVKCNIADVQEDLEFKLARTSLPRPQALGIRLVHHRVKVKSRCTWKKRHNSSHYHSYYILGLSVRRITHSKRLFKNYSISISFCQLSVYNLKLLILIIEMIKIFSCFPLLKAPTSSFSQSDNLVFFYRPSTKI